MKYITYKNMYKNICYLYINRYKIYITISICVYYYNAVY